MHLRLKTKITLIISGLVLAVVVTISWLYMAALTRQVIRQSDNRARQVAQEVFYQAQTALVDSAEQGNAPLSNSPEDIRNYVRGSLDQNPALASLIDAEVGYSSLVYEVTIVDHNGTALISSDASLRDRPVLPRTPLDQLASSSFIEQLRVLFGPPRAYQVAYPFNLGPAGHQVPFGEIRVAVQTGLLRNEIAPTMRSAAWLAGILVLVSVLLAFVVSSASLAPLERISAQLDRISRGEFDQKPLHRSDEFGQVSTKISQIGQQLRGVREIFSTLRENLDQVLGGLEDGLLLFTRDGRAVMVSPAVERFLGIPADQLLGREAGDIFPPDHPLRAALRLDGGSIAPVSTQVELPAAGDRPARAIGVSAQAIAEGSTRMGALVTLTDLESRERISTQLQVSERLAALGRVTAGVAHEVKNPLNSMRLWLENLKGYIPVGDEPQQAVRVLDAEIDRLDTVVKRFLDFTRPVEMHLEESSLAELIQDVLDAARPELEAGKVSLDAHLSPSVPAALVDRQLLHQALLNLILNAIEAMHGGGTLTVDLERRGDNAEIRIRDTGRGIAPEHRARIFQLFFTTRPGGSGIGLASAFRTVQMHDGSIDYDSEIGRGTTFRIDLPLERAGEIAAARASEPGHTTVPRA
ncbi:MAG: ATP-binding protein [Candidatus Acidiferrales bacterium]|jgi:PAS domain S-box-containing protein